MLVTGDEVFYPNHGAGCVKDVETLQITGSPQEYYKIFIASNSLSLYVPTNEARRMGLRKLSSPQQLEEARQHFFAGSAKLPMNSTERKTMLKDKLHSGTAADLYEILRDMVCSKGHDTKLTADDKHVMEHTLHLLSSELMMVRNISLAEAEQLLKKDMEVRSASMG
ncbi:CarD family transcriptional regulator [Paenibacillus tengchongensis]|uniref:CarD family transcriptional regulator n=1 Tax=Paenibacillus tengchongensis TaxID=2608684 RepID=UPI00124C52FC|nr:CarD family transcriptional regulator [Paenibacillus tengchongensis]